MIFLNPYVSKKTWLGAAVAAPPAQTVNLLRRETTN